MESIETREHDLIQHIRTAGLQKRREIALVDEVLELRKEKRQVFSNLASKVESLTKLLSESEKERVDVLKNTKEQLDSITLGYEDNIRRQKEESQKFITSLSSQVKELSIENNKLKEYQNELTIKYNKKMGIVEKKMNEIINIQQKSETSLKSELEFQIKAGLKSELETKHEIEIAKLKDIIRSLSDRENDLKNLLHDQKSTLKAFKIENE